MIRPAWAADLDAVAEAVTRLVAAMNAAGNDQWGPTYPARSDFEADLSDGALFVDDGEGRIRGFVALNQVEPGAYDGLPWTVDRPALVVHRLAVVPEFHRRGVADGLVTFAEDRARWLGLGGLRSDTADRNPGMNALFERRAWTRVGTLRFDDATVGFVAWEKALGLG